MNLVVTTQFTHILVIIYYLQLACMLRSIHCRDIQGPVVNSFLLLMMMMCLFTPDGIQWTLEVCGLRFNAWCSSGFAGQKVFLKL